jgi:DNA adenine methylase
LVFPYIGGKSNIADWVVENLPAHRRYVEPFSGSAAVLFSKAPSPDEVINDVDGDIVQFFFVLRERGDELAEWLRDVPYARDVHESWSREFYDGVRPNDPVERAGRFFFLRYSQQAAKYDSRSGFKATAFSSPAKTFENKRERLREFADRLSGVVVENKDYREMFEMYDRPNDGSGDAAVGKGTVFYCDPPYIGERSGDEYYSVEGGFDHAEFVDALGELEGDFVVSYDALPPELEVKIDAGDAHLVERGYAGRSGGYQNGEAKETVERLVTSFDPLATPRFAPAGMQATLDV